ncbi:MAG: DUF1330 domain-containing protein [Alphaproteobacteria bacterium]|nr:DUF1330 domain-containing protein [Alphaproteobacteria bacterium]
MPKGYWIAHVTVTDPKQYQHYASGTREAFQKYGANILARGGAFHQMEGDGHPRNVVIEFPSLQAAVDCYDSPEYQAAKAKREGAGIASIVLVEGV